MDQIHQTDQVHRMDQVGQAHLVIPSSLPSQDPTPPELLHTPSGLARSQFRAMGTTISMLLPEEHLHGGEEIVRELFVYWEQALSRFLEQSELSQLNRLAGLPAIVSELLYTVLDRALTAARATDGLYDPTLLKQLIQLGYDRTFDEIPAQQQAIQHPLSPGGRWRDIQIGPTPRLVMLPAGVGVDFGGIAKGMAVDAALDRLREEGIQTALVNAGGDLAVIGVPAQEQHWPIEVQGKDRSWVIPLQRGAFATSGIARRHWQQGTQMRHHLIDPRTGQSVQGDLWSVTVVAPRCEQAEVAAKVAFLLGVEQGSAFLHKHELAGLLVRDNGSWTTVGPWPEDATLTEDEREA